MTASKTTSAPEAPGPTGVELAESVTRYSADPFAESLRLFDSYGDVVSLRRGPFVTTFLFHPEHARHVLITKNDDYSRRTTPANQLKLSIGDGLVVADKPAWTRMKRLVQPGFTKKALDDWVPMMNEVASELVKRWQRHDGDAPINVHHDFGQCLLDIVARMLLGERLSELESEQVRSALMVAADLDQAMPRAELLHRSSEGAPEGARRAFQQRYGEFETSQKALDSLLDHYIGERRKAPTTGDLLSALIESRDEDGTGFTDVEVRNQLKTMVAAGHDTTMSALSFTLYALARYPHYGTRVRQEILDVCGGQPPSPQQLGALPFTSAFIDETLRLWPPVAHMDRRAEKDDVIGGYRIPKGRAVALSPFVVHRRPDLWEDPLEFRPQRFPLKNKSAYFPFSIGPRVCLGRALALMEIKLFLVHLVPLFDFRQVDGFSLRLKSAMTVHPVDGTLPLWVDRRSAGS